MMMILGEWQYAKDIVEYGFELAEVNSRFKTWAIVVAVSEVFVYLSGAFTQSNYPGSLFVSVVNTLASMIVTWNLLLVFFMVTNKCLFNPWPLVIVVTGLALYSLTGSIKYKNKKKGD